MQTDQGEHPPKALGEDAISMEVEVPHDAQANPNDVDEDEERFRGTFIWRLENARHTADTQQKVYSTVFELGTYSWRLLVFPRGNNKPSLSVYLDAPEVQYLPHQMCPKAHFTLSIINHRDPSRTWSKETNHTFQADASDWGFTETVPLQEVYHPQSGFLLNEGLDFKVSVHVLKDEACNSRKETGFVGLKNQGATCYMNSLLQYLYNLPYFRKAVYHMPTSEIEEYSKNMPLALQSLFFKLQYSRTTVATKDLTKSFGWNTQDAFMQHDVQELNRVLCEKLEEKMKGTRVERAVNELFEGATVNYIRCLNVQYTSERKEVFMDLQLDVKGCRNIYDSFDRYTEVEIMNGANQYQAENYGLQDAEKGVKFHSFPPVLQLQLKRFEYDFQRDAMVKINDRYEFYDTLDLDKDDRKYLDKTADPAVRNTYLLHSVLVHSGGVHGGHYYAFVRPDRHTWLRFDDERVTKETQQKAMEEQFGDDEQVGVYAPMGGMRFPKHSNAYMLVYIREDDWDRIMCSVSSADLPEPVRMRFESELRDKERRQQEKMEAHMFVNVKIATDQDIREQIAAGRAFDLVDHDLLKPEKGAFRVGKNTKVIDMKRMVERVLGVPVNKQRYWQWGRRPNGTVRAIKPLNGEQVDELKLLDLKDHGTPCKNAIVDVRLYLETPKSQPHNSLDGELYQPVLDANSQREVLLFAKLYNPQEGKLSYIGRCFVALGMSIKDVARTFMKMAGLPDALEVDVFEEIKPEPTLMVQPLKRKQLVQDIKHVMDGDILILQPRVPEEQLETLAHPSIQDYLTYVQQRRIVMFKPLLAEEPSAGPTIAKSQSTTTLASATGNPTQPGSTGSESQGPAGRHTPPPPALPVFTLELRDDMTYDDVTQRVAHQLGMLPEDQGASLLRLTQHNQYTHAPQRQPLKQRQTHSLQTMLAGATGIFQGARNHSGAHHPNDILYYEVLDMPLEQLEQLRTFKVTFHKACGEPSSEHIVRLPREAQVAGLLAEVARQLGQALDGKELRLLLWHSGKIFKMLNPGDSIESIGDDNSWRLRVEVVPPEESGLEFAPSQTTGERLLHCYHCLLEKQPAGPVMGPVNAPSSLAPSPAPAPQLPPPSQHPGPNSMDVSQQQGADSPPLSTAGTAPVVQHPPAADMPAPATPPQPGPPVASPSSLIQFGDPLLVQCGQHDTLGSIKARLQAKLGASDEELAKWSWAFCSTRYGYEPLHNDQEPIGQRLLRPGAAATGMGNEHPYLAMEHEDDKPRRPIPSARLTYERPVKIYT